MDTSDYDRSCPNFLGLTGSRAQYENARVVVIPAPYDATTYRPGARFGPGAILAASQEVEWYDPETGREPFLLGIATHPPLEPLAAGPEKMVKKIEEAAASVIADGKFPVLIGGEHLVSLGLIKALKRAHGDLTVLSLDAHPDLRDTYQESQLSNACVMRRAFESCRLVLCGVRTGDREEWEFIEKENIPAYTAWDLKGGSVHPEEVAGSLAGKVHISIDLDVFDPGIMPCVGTPEPGGLPWETVLAVIRHAAEEREVVGLDVVELTPLPGLYACDFTAATLILKALAYIMPGLMAG